MTSDFQKIARAIHKSIHDPDSRGVKINGQPFYTQTARNGCRYITYKGRTFIQQDPDRWGRWAERAQRGERITRIQRPKKSWGTITDNAIIDPLDGA